jgi:lipid-A-disaccharide synthase
LDKERRKQAAPRLVTTEGVLVSLGDVDDIKKRARRASGAADSSLPPFVIAEALTYDVMAHSDALICCSGTATLEAAILGTPMVIIYRGSRWMELEVRVIRRIRPEHIGLPNIIANERIVPELLQQDANPEALAEATLSFLLDPAHRAETKRRLEQVRNMLGAPGASSRTADLALKTAGLHIQ